MLDGPHAWLGTVTGVVFLTVAALPLAALTTWHLTRRRKAPEVAPALRLSLADVGIVYGTIPCVWITQLPGSRAGDPPERVHLTPLQDLIQIVSVGPLSATGQILGNLVVFAALGFFAPMRYAALASIPRLLALTASCSILIETAQYVLRLDRVSSIDDVLLNAAGAGLAALASRRWWCTAAQSTDLARANPST